MGRDRSNDLPAVRNARGERLAVFTSKETQASRAAFCAQMASSTTTQENTMTNHDNASRLGDYLTGLFAGLLILLAIMA